MGSSVVLTDDDDNALNDESCIIRVFISTPQYTVSPALLVILNVTVSVKKSHAPAMGVHIRVVEQLSKNENQMEKASRQKYNVPVCPSVCNSRTN